MGGHETVRKLWRDYLLMDSISAVLFIVDAADYERLEEAGDELYALVHGEGDGGGNGDHGWGLKDGLYERFEEG